MCDRSGYTRHGSRSQGQVDHRGKCPSSRYHCSTSCSTTTSPPAVPALAMSSAGDCCCSSCSCSSYSRSSCYCSSCCCCYCYFYCYCSCCCSCYCSCCCSCCCCPKPQTLATTILLDSSRSNEGALRSNPSNSSPWSFRSRHEATGSEHVYVVGFQGLRCRVPGFRVDEIASPSQPKLCSRSRPL